MLVGNIRQAVLLSLPDSAPNPAYGYRSPPEQGERASLAIQSQWVNSHTSK